MHLTPPQAVTALRVSCGAMMLIHGIARAWFGGVAPFGEFLTSQGLPMGLAIATAITAIEIVGAPVLILGRLVRPLAGYFAVQLMVGIAMVHFREGWFVVGLGRNGMEYSVLLIVGFVIVGLATPSRVATTR